MKTFNLILYSTCIILLSGILIENVLAQVEALSIPDEAERNYSRIFQNYDDAQQKTEEIEQRWLESGAWGNHRRKTYEYEDDGGTVITRVQFWQNGRWNNASREVETYNGNNNLTSRTREQWSRQNEWIPEQRDVYTYDDEERKIEWQNQLRNDDDNWIYNWRFTYSYAEGDTITGITYEEWTRNGWDAMRQIEDEYDNNKRTERIIYESQRGRRTPDKSYQYEYDEASGELTRQLTRRWTGNAWTDIEEELYSYDEEGRLIETEYRELQNGDTGQLIAREIVEYNDDENNTVERIRLEQTADGEIEEAWRYVYNYDFRGYNTVKSFYIFQDDGWIEQVRTTYTYDVYGNRTSIITQK